MSTSEKISFLRSRGVKINDLSTRLGVSRQFIHLLSKGHRKLSPEKTVILDTIVSELSDGKQSVDTLCKHNDIQEDIRVTMKSVENRLSSIETLLIDLLAKIKKS